MRSPASPMKRTRRCREIGIAAERVEHLAVGAAVERVDREVAPARVGRPVVGEGHGGVAAVRLHVLAQRGDLVGHVLGDDRDGAVRDAGRHGLEAGGFGGGDHLLGPRRRWRCRRRPPAGRAARCARRRRRRAPQSPRAASAANTACVSGAASQSASLETGRSRTRPWRRALLELAGLDAPVFHARRRIDLRPAAAGRRWWRSR